MRFCNKAAESRVVTNLTQAGNTLTQKVRRLIASNTHLPMPEQGAVLENAFQHGEGA